MWCVVFVSVCVYVSLKSFKCTIILTIFSCSANVAGCVCVFSKSDCEMCDASKFMYLLLHICNLT